MSGIKGKSGVYVRTKEPWNKGKTFAYKPRAKRGSLSSEYKKKISDSLKGVNTWAKGSKVSEETKLKISIAFTKEKHPMWIKDRTQLKTKGDRRSSAYANWRKEVWLRDNFTCKIANPECSGRIEAHHILGYSEHPELRYKTNNGITLCHAHHPRVRAEEKRLIPTFQELVSVSTGTN